MLLSAFNCECAPLTITGHNDFSDSVTHEEFSVMENIYSRLVPVWDGFSLVIFLFCFCCGGGEERGGGWYDGVHEHNLHCCCSVGLVSWDFIFALIFSLWHKAVSAFIFFIFFFRFIYLCSDLINLPWVEIFWAIVGIPGIMLCRYCLFLTLRVALDADAFEYCT